MAFGKRFKKDEALVYDSFEQLLEILANERRKSLKRRKMVTVGVVLYISIILFMMLIIGLSHGNPGSMAGMLNSIGGICAAVFAVSQTQRKAVQALANFDDIRAVPCLIEALDYNDAAMQEVANEQLPGLLARMQASDADLLTKDHHTILNKVLKTNLPRNKSRKSFMRTAISKRFIKAILGSSRYDSGLRMAILQALQQVGDESSLPVVEELAEGNGQAKKSPELQQAAQDCLPFLRQRAEHQQQMQTLLRASDRNLTPVAMLLHPAMPAALDTDAAELLRIALDTEEPQIAQVETTVNPHIYQEIPTIYQHVSSDH